MQEILTLVVRNVSRTFHTQARQVQGEEHSYHYGKSHISILDMFIAKIGAVESRCGGSLRAATIGKGILQSVCCYLLTSSIARMVFRWVFVPWLQRELDSYKDRINLSRKRRDHNKVSIVTHNVCLVVLTGMYHVLLADSTSWRSNAYSHIVDKFSDT